ncbi:MAG: acyl carrier protein phosphodiesterase [Acidobacteriaceae bacterium]|nr:acyl carrier protein phosphodiesterase [Acidobacteriaceae bacterium]
MALTVLTIASSPMGERSVTRKLTDKVVDSLKTTFPDSHFVTRDLVTAPLPHIDGLFVAGVFTRPEDRNEALQAAVAASDKAVDELIAADVIVIGAPMYNFGIPSSLKAWIDHVVRMGRTFTNGASGPEGLLLNKKVIVVSARGHVYTAGPYTAWDHQEPQLRTALGFMGLSNISFIRAEGLQGGAEASEKAFTQADQQLSEAVNSVKELDSTKSSLAS